MMFCTSLLMFMLFRGVEARQAGCNENRCLDQTRYDTATDITYNNNCGTYCTNPQTGTTDPLCTYANDQCYSKAELEALARTNGKTFSDTCCDVCFSAMSTAMVMNKGKTLIKELKIGDKVLTGSGDYQEVYTIDHKNENVPTDFIQIYTADGETDVTNEVPLELSGCHLIFLHNQKDPIQASQVKVGDVLKAIGANTNTAVVTKISSVTREGLWNPITKDGTIVVDGIVTSTYTATAIITAHDDRDKVYVEVAGFKLLSTHDFIHLLMTPYRAICLALPTSSSFASSFCDVAENEEFNWYNKFGLKFIHFGSEQPSFVKDGMTIGALFFFSVLYLTIMNPMVTSVVIISASYYIVTSNKNKKKIN